jgi:serine/threonine-protein kinase RsbW
VDHVVDPTHGDALLRPGGRGVYLMRNIMDTVDFKENGRVVELEKKNANGANGVNGHEPV